MSGGDTSMAGVGSIVAGTGVDFDIVPPSTVKVGKAQAEELAGMTNELKRQLRDLTAEQLGAGVGAKTKKSVVAMCSVVAGSTKSHLTP